MPTLIVRNEVDIDVVCSTCGNDLSRNSHEEGNIIYVEVCSDCIKEAKELKENEMQETIDELQEEIAKLEVSVEDLQEEIEWNDLKSS